MNILALNDTASTSDFVTRKNAVERRIISHWPIKKICAYYHVNRSSLWRWIKKYNGNDESLALKSHRPLTKHPKTASDEFVAKVLNIHKRSPNKSPFEIWVDLFSSKEFNYCFMTVLRIFQRSGIYQKYKTNPRKKHNKLYKTPENVGEKWQIDVKYVPRECKASNLEGRFYQYTVLDEATRKRFLYFTKEHSMYETVKCLKNAIKYFKYMPEIIQTDNGFEFSDQASKKYKGKDTRKYNNYLENFLKSVKIEHKFIRPRTPEHNGKVERSHRIDQEKFYRNLKFYSLEDLRYQGAVWNKKYNNMRRFVLNFKNPNEIELEKMSKNKISYH